MRHILTARNFTPDDINNIFRIAKDIESPPPFFVHKADRLAGKVIGTLFFEPSTRTRWSTEVAALRLGAKVVTMDNVGNSSTAKGESLADTVRTCSQYVDALVIRHPQAGSVAEAAQYSSVPVINAGDGSNEHPTQALLDLYTIWKLKDIQGTIMFTGDLEHSRTIPSLLQLIGAQMQAIFVKKREAWDVPVNYDHLSSARGFTRDFDRWVFEDEAINLLPEVDVLYMTRHQAERGLHGAPKFQMTKALAETMRQDAIIMHPLPRNNELLEEVDDDPRAVYFQQVKLGMYVRMGLLCWLLHK